MKLKEGFTLIELLVVISIIGLLASTILVALKSSITRANDGKLTLEIRSFQDAFYLSSSNPNLNAYPECLAMEACDITDFDGQTDIDANFAGFVTNGYISKIPHYSGWPANEEVNIIYDKAGYTYNSILNRVV